MASAASSALPHVNLLPKMQVNGELYSPPGSQLMNMANHSGPLLETGRNSRDYKADILKFNSVKGAILNRTQRAAENVRSIRVSSVKSERHPQS